MAESTVGDRWPCQDPTCGACSAAKHEAVAIREDRQEAAREWSRAFTPGQTVTAADVMSRLVLRAEGHPLDHGSHPEIAKIHGYPADAAPAQGCCREAMPEGVNPGAGDPDDSGLCEGCPAAPAQRDTEGLAEALPTHLGSNRIRENIAAHLAKTWFPGHDAEVVTKALPITPATRAIQAPCGCVVQVVQVTVELEPPTKSVYQGYNIGLTAVKVEHHDG